MGRHQGKSRVRRGPWTRRRQGEPSKTCLPRPSVDKTPRLQPNMGTRFRRQPATQSPAGPSVGKKAHVLQPHRGPVETARTLSPSPPGPSVDKKAPRLQPYMGTRFRREPSTQSPAGPRVDWGSRLKPVCLDPVQTRLLGSNPTWGPVLDDSPLLQGHQDPLQTG